MEEIILCMPQRVDVGKTAMEWYTVLVYLLYCTIRNANIKERLLFDIQILLYELPPLGLTLRGTVGAKQNAMDVIIMLIKYIRLAADLSYFIILPLATNKTS